jgi:hypothetical protein
MILTRQQAEVIRHLLSGDNLVLGRKKYVGSRVIFNVSTGIALFKSKDQRKTKEPVTVHGRIVNDMVRRGLLKQKKGSENYVLSERVRSISPEDLISFNASGKPRVTDAGICSIAKKYGYGFEFQRVIGTALFTKDGVGVVGTSIRIDRLSDKSLTEWEEHLSSYIRKSQ